MGGGLSSLLIKEIKGFTLAETLITLGIIGIVAALTLPTVINNYKKHETIVELKSAYTLISQAIAAAEVKNGDIAYWDFSDMDKILYEYIAPYLKIKEFKAIGEHNYTHIMCDPDMNFPMYKFLDGGGMGSPFRPESPSIQLTTGACIAIDRSDVDSQAVQLYIDINGPQKQPNVVGKDLFKFKLIKNSKKIVPHGSTIQGAISSNTVGGCNKSSRNPGLYCAFVIMYEGWKIPDYYPW